MQTRVTTRRRALLQAGLVLLPLLLVACIEIRMDSTGSNGGTPPPASTAPAAEIEAVEDDITAMINDRRADEGLDALSENATLVAVARDYSCRMLNEDFFAHESPDGDTVADRVAPYDVDYRYLGENLAFRKGPGGPGTEGIVEGWMDSEGHRENILRDDYTETGVGVCHGGETWYFTQLFMRPR